MPDHPGLLQSIIDNPDDDAVRLVYADWLDDHGDAARAQFIRLQCGLARYCRDVEEPFLPALEADRLLPEHRQAFLAPLLELGLPDGISRYHQGESSACVFYFRRGFVEDIDVFGSPAVRRLVNVAEGLFARTPVRHLRLRPYDLDTGGRIYGFNDATDRLGRENLRALVRLPQMERLQSLDLTHQFLDDTAGLALLGSPHLSKRTQLILTGARFSQVVERAFVERFGEAVSFGGPTFVPDDEIPF